MTREKPLPRPCECGCGVLLAQRARLNGSPRRFYSEVCARRAKREATAEQRAIWAFKARLRRADAKARLLAL